MLAGALWQRAGACRRQTLRPRTADALATPEGDQREMLVAAFDGPLIGGPDPADIELVVDHAGLQRRRLDGQERVARGGGGRADAGGEARDGELVFCLPGAELLAGAVADLGVRRHEDARSRPTHARPPAAFPAHDLAGAVERRGVLAEVPDVALAVLGVEVGGALRQAALLEQAVADDGRSYARDALCPRRHGHHVDGRAPVLDAAIRQPGAWDEREPRVIDPPPELIGSREGKKGGRARGCARRREGDCGRECAEWEKSCTHVGLL